MGLQCLVIPCAGLVPAACGRLGEALHRWRSADPAARSPDQLALDDLRDGGLPPPRYVRFIRAAQERAQQALSYQEREDIRSGLGDGADTRPGVPHRGRGRRGGPPRGTQLRPGRAPSPRGRHSHRRQELEGARGRGVIGLAAAGPGSEGAA